MVQDLIPEIKITEQKWQRKAKLENKVINHQKRTHKSKETKKKVFRPKQQPALMYSKCQMASQTKRQTYRETDRYVYCCSWRS